MVDFSFTKEQVLIRESLCEWCEKKLPLDKIRGIGEKHENCARRKLKNEMLCLNC